MTKISAQAQKSPPLAEASVDPKEIAHFAKMAADWWDPAGDFAPLHKLNPARLAYVRERIDRHFRLDSHAMRPLKGTRVLDLGCGGGLLSEPMARLGAETVGIDATAENIAVARAHAQEMGLDIDYRHATAEQLARQGEQFDIILILEIIEHVADAPAFLATCHSLLKPDGLLLFSTLNRSARSFLTAIVGAEYVLRWLPRGTHDWHKFLTPQEFSHHLASAGFEVTDLAGLSFAPLSQKWTLGEDMSVNYLGSAHPAAPQD